MLTKDVEPHFRADKLVIPTAIIIEFSTFIGVLDDISNCD
jgi:hypothetical protein